MTYRHGFSPSEWKATDMDELLELDERWTQLRMEEIELQSRLGAPRIMVMGR